MPVASWITWATVAIVGYFYGGEPGIDLTIPLGVLGLVAFAFSALSSYLVYLLVNRRNMHFARMESVLWIRFNVAKSKAQQADTKTLVVLGSAEHDLARLSETVRERSAILWALLTVVPYAGWLAMTYVLAFLTHDVKRHEQREDIVIEDLSGITQSLPQRAKRTPTRPVIPFIIVGLATVGVFLLPWLYWAVRDPTEHFVYHRSVEPVLKSESTLSSAGGLE